MKLSHPEKEQLCKTPNGKHTFSLCFKNKSFEEETEMKSVENSIEQ